MRTEARAVPQQELAAAMRYVLRRLPIPLLLTASVLASSCATLRSGVLPSTSGSAAAPASVIKGIGNLFDGVTGRKSAKLSELVDKRDFDAAAALYEQESAYFYERKGKDDEVLTRLANALNANRLPTLRDSAEAVVAGTPESTSVSEWADVRKSIRTLDDGLSAYERVALLRADRFRSAEIQLFTQRLSDAQVRWKKRAAEFFAGYDHFNGPLFYPTYPVDLDARAVLSEAYPSLSGTLAQLPAERVEQFATRYRDALTAEIAVALGGLYLRKLIDSETADGTFFRAVELVKVARDKGFALKTFETLGVAVVALEETNSSRHSTEFIDENGAGVRRLTVSQLTADAKIDASEYELVLRSLPAEIDRKVARKEQVRSRKQVGTQRLPNPAYVQAQAKFIEVQSNYNAQRMQNAARPGVGVWAALAQGLSEGVLAGAVSKARDELAHTPPTIEEPIFEDYEFSVSTIDSRRLVRVGAWILDKRRSAAANDYVDIEDRKSFKLAYNVDLRDIEASRIALSHDGEEAIDRFEQEQVQVRVERVLEALMLTKPSAVAFADRRTLFDTAAPHPRQVKVDASRTNDRVVSDDPRFNSVVVVKNPAGGFGSGFFVGSNLVVTNYHVVEGSNMAEILLRNGIEGVGRVVRTDPGLDLALIKVTDQGEPVQFASEPIQAGLTVEAIGHPSGMMFSMTRGIVSAVRKMPNALVKGSRDMLVIQTDAAISPGNSGGPLFWRDKVVGVNSQKLVRRGVEGVGFAVHHAEIQRFIAEP